MKTPEEWQNKLEYVFIKQKTIAEIQDEAWNAALDAAAEITDDHYIDEDENIYVSQSEILKLKK
jgi:hypothetical protein